MTDPLRNEHENGDADGLGFFRGCLNALAAMTAAAGAIYLLVRYVIMPYMQGD